MLWYFIVVTLVVGIFLTTQGMNPLAALVCGFLVALALLMFFGLLIVAVSIVVASFALLGALMFV